MVVTSLGRHDARAHHTLKVMATYHLLSRLEHFHGFAKFSNAELELLQRQLQQLVSVVSDVLRERG